MGEEMCSQLGVRVSLTTEEICVHNEGKEVCSHRGKGCVHKGEDVCSQGGKMCVHNGKKRYVHSGGRDMFTTGE